MTSKMLKVDAAQAQKLFMNDVYAYVMYLFAKMLVMKMYIAKDTRVKWADFATLQRIRHVLFKAVQDKILERLENFHQHLHADQKTLKDVTLSKKVRNTNKTNDKYIFNVVCDQKCY